MISVIVATYGSDEWLTLGARAVQSATVQADEVIREHQPKGTLAQARNDGALRAKGDYLIFLDGDDELEPGYVDAMRKAVVAHPALYAPRVSYVTKGRVQQPKYWPEVSLRDGNWLVIGTMVPRKEFLASGGFREYGAYEDYELFARFWRDNGEEIIRVPNAIYRAHWRQDSRNKIGRGEALYWHQRIGHDVFPEKYDAPTHEEDGRRTLLDEGRVAGRLRLHSVGGR